MRRMNSKLVSATLAVIVFSFIFLFYSPLHTYALTTQQQVSFKGNRNADSQIARLYLPNPTKILSNKTPSVAKVSVLDRSIKGHQMYIIVFRFKKNKPATITVENMDTNNSYDIELTPIPYTSPAKSVKIDGKSYFTGNTWIQESKKKLNGKIKIVTKKNWKVIGIYKFNINQWNKNPTPDFSMFKNGGKISVKKNERLVIKYENTKTKQVFNMFYDCGFNHTK